MVLNLKRSLLSNLLPRCLQTSFSVATALVAPLIVSVHLANADIELVVRGKPTIIKATTGVPAIKAAVKAVMAGQASLKVSQRNLKTFLRRGQLSVNVAGSKISLEEGIPRFRGGFLLNPNSKNRKTAELSISMLGLLTSLLSTSEQNSSTSGTASQIKVFREYQGMTCEPPQQSLEELDAVLANRNVTILGSVCASPRVSARETTVCGQPFTFYRIHTISERDKLKAMMAGFSPLNWLRTEVQEGECPNFGTVEMIGVLENQTCSTTKNSAEELDARLAKAGIRVLEASCGMVSGRSPAVCGVTELTFRKVKIFASQRQEAALLGLRDSAEFSGIVFGQACPLVVIIDPPLRTVEMVGVIFNVVCNPPVNTVASFDRMLSDAGVDVFGGSCGFEKTPSQLPCPTIFREVLIPQSQQSVAENLGLFRKEDFASTVNFGSRCD